jgi:hypothetical protein
MRFNWGGFASGVGNGLESGMRLGDKLGGLRDKAAAQAARDDAVAQAKQEFAAQQAGAVRDNGALAQEQGAAQGAPVADVNTYKVDMPVNDAQLAANGISMPAQKRFAAAGGQFDDAASAQKAAAADMPSLKDFTAKKVAERLEQHYMEAGDMDSADKWGKWHKDKANEKKMEDWAEAYRLNQTGDYMASARKIIKLHGHYSDGFDVVSADPIKDANGKETGFNLVYKDGTGKQSTMQMDAQAMSDMGVAQLNPQALFQMDRQALTTASAARAKAAADNASDARDMKKSLAIAAATDARDDRRTTANNAADIKKAELLANGRLDEIRLRENLESANVGKKEQAALDVKLNLLRKAGHSDADINDMIPSLLKVENFKKATDPAERRAMVITDMVKADPMFARLPPEKQAERVNAVMGLITPGKPAAATPKPAPAAKPATAGAAPTGRTRYDSATKTLVPY